MITVRKSEERGHFQSEWLDSRHTFSFDTYHDPDHMAFRALRVINEDRVQGGRGFPLHPHRDMEILTFIIEGALKHTDSLGHEEIIGAGEVQRITAGSGIRHSEFNPSRDAEVHLLQIWILPERMGLEPGYETVRFAGGDEPKALRLIASPDGRDGSATIHQDASVFAGRLVPGKSVTHELGADRHAWLQVIRGSLSLNGIRMEEGDGASASFEPHLEIEAESESEFLLFDLG